MQSAKREKLQLMLQALQQLGYVKTVDVLQREAAELTHESPQVQTLRELIFGEEWAQALEFVASLRLEEGVERQVRLVILEQKYLQLLQRKETQQAVEVMRKHIQPICGDRDRLHVLATHLMATMQQEDIPVRKPVEIFNDVFGLCHRQINSFQPRRLETLFVQAKSKQILEDDWHPGLDDNYQLQSVSPTNPNITDASSFVSFRSHDDEVYDRSHYARWFCQFSPNGKYLASACKKNRLCVWELSTREGKYTWSRVLNEAAHHQSIHLITFSPCSQLVATCSQDQSAKVFMLFPEVKLLYTLKGHQNRICGLGWRLSDATQQVKQKKYFSFIHKKGQTVDFVDFWEIYTGSLDGWINVWKAGQKKSGFKTEPVTSLVVYRDRIMIEHASLRKISFYDALRRTELKQLLEKDEIVSSCLNNDFSLLLVNVSYVAPRLNLYNVENLQLLKSFQGYLQTKYCLRGCFGWFNHNLVAIGSEDGYIFIWHKYNDRKPLLKTKISEQSVNQLAFNPEFPSLFAAACDDKLLRVYYPPSIQMAVVELDVHAKPNLSEQIGNFIQRLGRGLNDTRSSMPAQHIEDDLEFQSQDDMDPMEDDSSEQ